MNIRFMENRNIFYFISLTLLVVSVLLLSIKGLNYGIDFKGGNILHVTFDNPTNENAIRDAFKKIGETNSLYFSKDANALVVQNVANSKVKDREFIIQYPASTKESLEVSKSHDVIISSLKKIIPFSTETLEVSNIGPTIGEEMKRNGMLAAVISCIGSLLYLGWRFDFASATGVVIAIVHDLLITLGFIAAMRIEFDTAVLAAVLTLLGYSVNDSIVIFDRIRENIKISKNDVTYGKIIDNSINQSLARTVNTTITTLLALIALTLYGGNSIHGFAVALTFGCVIGTFSSNCIAAPVVSDLFKMEKKTKGSDNSGFGISHS